MLLLGASVGAGHNQAARAILAALEQRYPYVEAEFVDALALTPWWFQTLYAGSYTLGVTRFPRVYGWSYRMLDGPAGPQRTSGERLRLSAERLGTRGVVDLVARRRPSLVVATHYLSMPVLGRIVARGGADWRLWGVVTDYEAHRFWYSEGIDRYFVANEAVRGALVGWGVGVETIRVSGIPVHPKWTRQLDREAILRDWRLPDDVPIVLFSPGAFFTVGPVEQIVQGILAQTNAHVVVLAGANKKLLAALASASQAPRRITGVPFTDRVNELVEVASVMVTKSGGMTTSECIAKGVPMVLTRPVPGQEAANAEMLAQEGAAVVAKTAEEVVDAVAELIGRPEALAALRMNARRLYLPAAETIARDIIDALNE